MDGGWEDHRREELVRRGAEADGVELVEYQPRDQGAPTAWARSRRVVLFWWGLAAVAGALAIAQYVAWPWRYVPPGGDGHVLYRLYNPLLGLLLGLALFGVCAGLVTHARRLLPEEVAVQQRHSVGPSSDEDREIFTATVGEAATRVGFRRRSVFGKAIGLGAGVAGASVTVVGIGGFVDNPWKPGPQRGEADTLWHTGWFSPNGEKVFLRKETTDPFQVELVRPGDIAPGGLLTVYPFRDSDRGDRDKLRNTLRESDNPASLFRFLPGSPITPRPDRAGMNVGDYYAFSRVCTHLGCAVNLYEKLVNRLMCPCHQSQFDLNAYANPIIGPAARALPQLPIALDDAGFFYATGDFTGPIGPTFWELPP